MFVERINEKEMRKFLNNNIRMDIKEIKLQTGKIDVCLEGVGSDLRFTFTDFGVEGHDIFAKAGADIVAEKWSGLMHTKFGREYIDAWLKHNQSKCLNSYSGIYTSKEC